MQNVRIFLEMRRPNQGHRAPSSSRGVKSGPGAARTILLFHTISASSSKQSRMVGSTLEVYSFRLIFVSAGTNKGIIISGEIPRLG
jgi:hypothetical protein